MVEVCVPKGPPFHDLCDAPYSTVKVVVEVVVIIPDAFFSSNGLHGA